MEIKTLPIKSLKLAEYNPRIINDKEMRGLVNSIKKFGIVDPIIINKDYTIIGGHMRVRACEKLGINEVPCNILDLDKKQEKKLNILLNSPKISGKYDELKLAELLEDMKLDDDYMDLNLDELNDLPQIEMGSEEDLIKDLENFGTEDVVVKVLTKIDTAEKIYQILNQQNDSTDKGEVILKALQKSNEIVSE